MQAVPLHPTVALAIAAHGVHDTPQLATSLSLRQAPVQAWKLELQTRPQLVESQVAEAALAGTGHGVQLVVPQVVTSLLSAQPSLHTCWLTPQVMPASTGVRSGWLRSIATPVRSKPDRSKPENVPGE